MGTWAALWEGCGCDAIFEARVQTPKKHAVENQSDGARQRSSDATYAAAVAAAEQRGANHGHAQTAQQMGREAMVRRQKKPCKL